MSASERAKLAARLRQKRFLSRPSVKTGSLAGALPAVKSARASPKGGAKQNARLRQKLLREGATALVSKALSIERRMPTKRASAIARKYVNGLSMAELVEVDAGRFDISTAIPRRGKNAADSEAVAGAGGGPSSAGRARASNASSAVGTAAAAAARRRDDQLSVQNAAQAARTKERLAELTPELTMWDAIVRDDVKEHAKEEKRERTRLRAERDAYRGRLDGQITRKEERVHAARAQRETDRVNVANQVAQWKADEEAKAGRLKAKAMKLKVLQEEQLEQQRAARELEKLRHVEEARQLNVRLAQLEIEAQEKEAARLAEAQRRIDLLTQQHEAHLVLTAEKKKRDDADALRLQREYIEREERNEKRRTDAQEERAARIQLRMSRMANGAMRVEADQRAEERRLMERDIALADAAKAARAKAKADKLAATIADLTAFNQMRLDLREKERLIEEEEKIKRREILDQKARADEEKEDAKQAAWRAAQKALQQDLLVQIQGSAKRVRVGLVRRASAGCRCAPVSHLRGAEGFLCSPPPTPAPSRASRSAQRNINVVEQEVEMNAGILRQIMQRKTTPSAGAERVEIISPLLQRVEAKKATKGPDSY